MAKYVSTISADGTTLLGNVTRPRSLPSAEVMFFGHGTWGSGTLTLLWSPDGGTTKIAVTDLTDSAISKTANFGVRGSFVTGDKNSDQIQLYATLAGATNPSLIVGFYDNH